MMIDIVPTTTLSKSIWESISTTAMADASVRTVCEVDYKFYPMWRREYMKVGHTEGKVHVRDIAISGTKKVSAAVNSADAQIQIFRRLGMFIANFKGAPSDKADLARAVNDGIRFLVHWPRTLPLPATAASECGELAFHWSQGNRSAIVRFEGDGAYGYALLVNERYESGQFDIDCPSKIPSDLTGYLALDYGTRAPPERV